MAELIQDSAVVDLSALAVNGGTMGLVRVDELPGPWILTCRLLYPGNPLQSLPGAMPFPTIRVQEGRGTAAHQWMWPGGATGYLLARDRSWQLNCSSLQASVEIAQGTVTPGVRLAAWVSKGTLAEQRIDGLLQGFVDQATAEGFIATGTRDLTIPPDTSHLELWCAATVSTLATAAPIIAQWNPTLLLQCTHQTVAGIMNRIPLDPRARFIAALGANAAPIRYPVTWCRHG